MSRTSCGLAVGLLAALLCQSPAQAANKADPNKLPSIRVQDLHYGEVLFQYYSGQEFEALTRARSLQPMAADAASRA